MTMGDSGFSLNEEWLLHLLKLAHGISSHDTLGRVCAQLDTAQSEEGFRGWMQEAFALTDVKVVWCPSTAERVHGWRGLTFTTVAEQT